MADNLDEKIRYRAYMLWQADGCPQGKEMDYWLKAEVEIKSELVRTAAPKKAPGKKKAPARKATPKKATTKRAAPKKPASKRTKRS